MAAFAGPFADHFWPMLSLGIFLGLTILISIQLFTTKKSKLDEAALLPFNESEEK